MNRDMRLRAAFEYEWQQANEARRRGELDVAFAHLERAHILGQSITALHVRSHLGMLALGWRRRAPREVLGQLSRLVAATLFSRAWVPIGNTGGANVSAFQPMPLPPDLHALLTPDADEIV